MDWGDGYVSPWDVNKTKVRRYADVGDYDAIGQARCAVDTLVESGWSGPRTITVHEVLSRPAKVIGPVSGETNETLTYTTTGSTSSAGHALEYTFGYATTYFDWVWTDWSPALSGDLVIPAAGTYRITVKARCITHPARGSHTSSYLENVVITVP